MHTLVATVRARLSLAIAIAAAIGLVAGGGLAPAARADDPAVCPASTDDAYTLAVGALTCPDDTDLALRFERKPGCAAVTAVKHVKVKTYTADGKIDDVRNFVAVEAAGGIAPLSLDRVERGRRIEVDALVQTGTPPRTVVVRDATTSRLRPDLVVEAVHVPPQTLTTRPVDVVADLSEALGDTDAGATVQLLGPLGPLAEPVAVDVEAGARASVTFPHVSLTTATPTELTVRVVDAAPAEYDDDNDTRAATV